MINNPSARSAIVWVLRILLGATFMISGLAKSIDVYGFIFKIEEYLTVWHISVARQIIVSFAIFLSGFEFVCGLLLSVGAYRRVVVLLLTAFISIMTVLTLYIWIADPISDCGCFGDFIILSNAATFWKNIIIAALLAPLFKLNKKVKGIYHPATQWASLALASLYILAIALYGYNVQPIVDFRSFKVGTYLIEPSDNEGEENEEFVFIYEKNGVTKEFPIDSLPDDSWTFIDRKPLFEPSSANSKTELNALNADGTSAIETLSDTTKNFLIIAAANPDDVDMPSSFYINRISELISGLPNNDTETVELIGAPNEEILKEFRHRTMSELEIFVAEPTVIKELARGDVALVYVDHGRMKWKRSMQSLNYDALRSNTKEYINSATTYNDKNLALFSIILIFSLVVLYLCDVSRKLFYKKHI